MFVGVGAARVARPLRHRPSEPALHRVRRRDRCDRGKRAPAWRRSRRAGASARQLLAEMDGYEHTQGIIVLAATTVPHPGPALLRAGPVHRQDTWSAADAGGAGAIFFAVDCRDKPLAADVDLAPSSAGPPGSAALDLATWSTRRRCAVRRTPRSPPGTWTRHSIDPARISRPSLALDADERRIVATTRPATPSSPPCCRSPIRCTRSRSPRWHVLGSTQQLPVRERHLHRRRRARRRPAVRLGGRAAELLAFGPARPRVRRPGPGPRSAGDGAANGACPTTRRAGVATHSRRCSSARTSSQPGIQRRHIRRDRRRVPAPAPHAGRTSDHDPHANRAGLEPSSRPASSTRP